MKSKVISALLETLNTKQFLSRTHLASLDDLDDSLKEHSKLLDGRIKGARRVLASQGYIVHNVRMLGYRVAQTRSDVEHELFKAIVRAHGKTLEALRLHRNYCETIGNFCMVLDFSADLTLVTNELFKMKKKCQQFSASCRSEQQLQSDHASKN